MNTPTKETPKLSTERNFTPGTTAEEVLKMEKDGLDVIDDVYRYAKGNFEDITEGDKILFKWHGMYLQKPKSDGYFMLRIRVPGGRFSSTQLDTVASIAKDYGHGLADITVRQAVQYHWLRIEQFPDIFSRLKAVGITTTGACGDIPRNILGCPIAGVDRQEIIDGTEQLQAVNAHVLNNREFSNLPRKYKISISGCRIHCSQSDINCLSFFGLEREAPQGVVGNGNPFVHGKNASKIQAGFGVKVGGGLAASPHLAKTLPIFLTPEEVLPVAHYISVVYRDHGFRHARSKARLKILVADWGVDKFLAKLEETMGRSLERHNEFKFPEDPETDHLGIGEQKEDGVYYVGLSFQGGRTRDKELHTIAALSKKYSLEGGDYLVNTNKQNMVMLNIPEKNLENLKKELKDNGICYEPSNFEKGCVSCTGIEFCNLAIAETKNRMMTLVTQLEKECSFYRDKIRIHFSGCPSSCGQHQIADIGFRGGMTKIDGVKTECFDMLIGGKLGSDARFSKVIKRKVLSSEIHHVISKLLKFYQSKKQEGELFCNFAQRLPEEEIKKALE